MGLDNSRNLNMDRVKAYGGTAAPAYGQTPGGVGGTRAMGNVLAYRYANRLRSNDMVVR